MKKLPLFLLALITSPLGEKVVEIVAHVEPKKVHHVVENSPRPITEYFPVTYASGAVSSVMAIQS